MKDLINAMFQIEFWIVVAFVFVIVIVFYTVLGDTFSTLRHKDESFAVFEVVPEPLEVGCKVYDVVTGDIGQYCGTHLGDDNEVYAVVILTEGNHIHYYYCVADSLLHIK